MLLIPLVFVDRVVFFVWYDIEHLNEKLSGELSPKLPQVGFHDDDDDNDDDDYERHYKILDTK